ncbi:hypothetical protein FOZ63_017743 [Perkinsus olseni]|uniref:Uncharacterized protein n=1 Tax=Perkinsus olseni TaxID=32597 RepID=A0A7J6N623_PEROL|nr:hypothetical protein FOZ63_017743 [Perkinsus olseni]KAF4711316.1 hypothetical protein FOZ62_027395 [Perkinsus olseni]
MRSAVLMGVTTVGMLLLSDPRSLAQAASAQPNAQKKETCTVGSRGGPIEFAIEDAACGRVSTVYIECDGTRVTGDGSGTLSNGKNDMLMELRLGSLMNCGHAIDRLEEALQPMQGWLGRPPNSELLHFMMCRFLNGPGPRR